MRRSLFWMTCGIHDHARHRFKPNNFVDHLSDAWNVFSCNFYGGYLAIVQHNSGQLDDAILDGNAD